MRPAASRLPALAAEAGSTATGEPDTHVTVVIAIEKATLASWTFCMPQVPINSSKYRLDGWSGNLDTLLR